MSMSNFGKIGQSVAKLLRFFNFSSVIILQVCESGDRLPCDSTVKVRGSKVVVSTCGRDSGSSSTSDSYRAQSAVIQHEILFVVAALRNLQQQRIQRQSCR